MVRELHPPCGESCTGSYTGGTFPGGGEGAVLAAAQTATTRSPPAALDGHESEPYRVARTTHDERRPGCPSGRRDWATQEEGTYGYGGGIAALPALRRHRHRRDHGDGGLAGARRTSRPRG